jgi:hypothetical protein
MFMWALAFAVNNRISTNDLDEDDSIVRCEEIPIAQYLPQESDLEEIHSRMVVLVERILCKYLDCFKELEGESNKPILHEYSKESCCKSDVVCQ